MTIPQPKLTRRRIADHYDRSIQTEKRWEKDGLIPPPDGRIYDEPFWNDAAKTIAIIDANLAAATTGRSAGYIRGRGNEGEAA